MIERDIKTAEGGKSRVFGILDGSLKRRPISVEKHQKLAQAFAASDSYSDLGNADLVIEAVFEDMDVKKQVFAQIEAAAKSDAILATNTSYLDVNEIAASIGNPARVIGLHFFSPAHIMKLLEIVVPDGIDDVTLATAVSFAKSLRKIPVLAGVCDGFIANRIMPAYRREAEYMVEDGPCPGMSMRRWSDLDFRWAFSRWVILPGSISLGRCASGHPRPTRTLCGRW